MTAQEFIFDLPLYSKVKNSDSHIIEAFYDHIRIDGYNPFRSVESTFQLRYPIDASHVCGEETRTLRFDCQRYEDSMYVLVHFDEEKDYIEKVGQYPSMADIHISQVKKYRKVLGESYIRDFTKAIGLAANGIGTGSYVYLRRIFEHLIVEIADEAIKNGEIKKEDFDSGRMDDRLKLLSSHLPEVVLENKPLYGVLSAGIHSLSEEDCLAYFPVVRTVVELILDERENQRQVEAKKKKAKEQLGGIAGTIKNKI